VIQLWDLRAIRRRLAGLGLDWDRPPDPPPIPWSSRPLVATIRSRPATPAVRPSPRPDPSQIDGLTAALGLRPRDAGLHYQRGLLRERGGDLEGALADYAEAHRLDADPKYLVARGWMHLRLGRDEQALADWMTSLATDASDPWDLYREAALRLRLGDRGRYREICRALVDKSRSSTDPYVAERVAKAGLMGGQPALDRAFFELADRAYTAEPELGWFLLTKGLAHYRLGQYTRSLGFLQQSLEADRGADGFSEALALALVAMNLARQHRRIEALRSLAEADQRAAERLQSADSDGLVNSWHDLLFFQVARREAAALIPR
jgi:tetratricopeptide (TPR) repeat protein